MLWGQGGCCRWWRSQEPQRGVRLIAATSAKTKASQSHPDPARLPICMWGKVVVGGSSVAVAVPQSAHPRVCGMRGGIFYRTPG